MNIGDFIRLEQTIPSIQPDTLFMIGSFPVTNVMLANVLVLFFIIWICLIATFTFKGVRVASKSQVALELMVDGLMNFVDNITGSREITRRIFPIVGSLFFYILFSNLLTTVIPFLESIEIDEKSAFRTPTSDINVTLMLSLGVVLLSHAYSIRKNNPIGHIGKYIKLHLVIKGFSKGIGTGLLALIDFFVGLLDIVSEIAKVISLSLRLFGNMFAGGLLIAVMMSMLGPLLPIPLMLMGLLSAVLQALVFSALSAAYLSMSIKD